MNDRFSIEPGERRDFESLSHLHYLPGTPACVTTILRCVDRSHSPELAGVLVVTMPTLNARWRRAAWPGLHAGDRRSCAAALNANVRRIARVVIEPRYRGLGLATKLVRAYLREPRTPCTEAVAAMGDLSPFFERAGMTRIALPFGPSELQLREELRAIGLKPWALLDVSRFREPALVEIVRRWAGEKPGLKRRKFDLAKAARGAALCGAWPRVVYVHGNVAE